MKKVTIYTDGSARGNPGPGGYGTVLLCGPHRKELSGGFRRTTNNRMEILAAIAGLKALTQRCEVSVYTDSKYLYNSMMKGWARSWRAKGWRKSNKEKALNADLWAQMLELCEQHAVTFFWVKGHAGNKENERCDTLCTAAACQSRLPADHVYERESP
jgi:ribonuclease HI